MLLKGSRKKGSSLNGRDIQRGGGVKGRAMKEKITFFGTFFFQRSNDVSQRPLSSRGEEGYALIDRPLREELFLFFCGFPNHVYNSLFAHSVNNKRIK